MPSKSKAQRNLMAAAAHNPAFAKRAGVPVSVAKEFNKADTGRKFKEGGEMKSEKAKELRHAKTLEKVAKEERAEASKMNCGGKVKKLARGGGIESKGKTKGKMVTMKRGGKC